MASSSSAPSANIGATPQPEKPAASTQTPEETVSTDDQKPATTTAPNAPSAENPAQQQRTTNNDDDDDDDDDESEFDELDGMYTPLFNPIQHIFPIDQFLTKQQCIRGPRRLQTQTIPRPR